MNRLLLAAFLSFGALLITAPSLEARPRQKAVAKRLSVLDYYFLLPGIGNSGYPTRRERESLLRQQDFSKPIIDLRHDYLSVQPDSSPREQITVFRGGSLDVVVQSAPDFQSDYNGFALYQLQDGKLRDVTEKLLPVPLNPNRFLLELPRVGTRIRVFSFNMETQSRKPAFDLLWRRGRFVKVEFQRKTR